MVERPCFWKWSTLCMTPQNYRAMMRSKRFRISVSLFLSPSHEDCFDFKIVKEHSMSRYVREVIQYILQNREELCITTLAVRENMEKVGPHSLAKLICSLGTAAFRKHYNGLN